MCQRVERSIKSDHAQLKSVLKTPFVVVTLTFLMNQGICGKGDYCFAWKNLCENQLSECYYQNPVIYGNHPDPGILRIPENDGGGFVLVSTSNYEKSSLTGPAFPILHSYNLIDWKLKGHVFPQFEWPQWADTDMWAPEIHPVNNGYSVYFSALHKKTGYWSIGVAISANKTNPFGPFFDFGRPIITHPDGVIDAHWFRDPRTKKPYLVWKMNGLFSILPAKLKMRRISENGFSFPRDAPTITLLSASFLFDDRTIEGAWLHYREPYYYLFFSPDGYLSKNYRVDVARSLNVQGPYECQREPVLKANLRQGIQTHFTATGHCSVVSAKDGSDWMLYHAWPYGKIGSQNPGRLLMLDKIYWTQEGWPFIGYPSEGPREKPYEE